MIEYLTIDEIKTRFSSEWMLIGDPDLGDNLAVLGGTVLWHSKDRDEVYRKDLELKPKKPAYQFTGTIPEGAEVVLCSTTFRS